MAANIFIMLLFSKYCSSIVGNTNTVFVTIVPVPNTIVSSSLAKSLLGHLEQYSHLLLTSLVWTKLIPSRPYLSALGPLLPILFSVT